MSASTQDLRIERIELNGRTAWRKRPEATRSSFYTTLHRVLSATLPQALQPTNAAGGIASLHAEAARLRHFAEAGVSVPEVLEETDSFITLGDCGPQLRGVLRNTAEFDARLKLMQHAMRSLADLHAKGLAHGRPFLKDMTLNKTPDAPQGQIYLLDLEEDPTATMNLEDAQARDVWLLLSSCAEFCDDPEAVLCDLLALYQTKAPSGLTDALRRLGRSLRPLRRLVGAVRAINISNDVRGSYWAIRTLETLS